MSKKVTVLTYKMTYKMKVLPLSFYITNKKFLGRDYLFLNPKRLKKKKK